LLIFPAWHVFVHFSPHGTFFLIFPAGNKKSLCFWGDMGKMRKFEEK